MLIENKKNDKVGNILKQNISHGTKLSIITNYFSLYAFSKLKKALSKIITFNASAYSKSLVSNKNAKIIFQEILNIKRMI